jgi:hypothetical protein
VKTANLPTEVVCSFFELVLDVVVAPAERYDSALTFKSSKLERVRRQRRQSVASIARKEVIDHDLADWAPDEAARRRILVDNPAALFGFSAEGSA